MYYFLCDKSDVKVSKRRKGIPYLVYIDPQGLKIQDRGYGMFFLKSYV